MSFKFDLLKVLRAYYCSRFAMVLFFSIQQITKQEAESYLFVRFYSFVLEHQWVGCVNIILRCKYTSQCDDYLGFKPRREHDSRIRGPFRKVILNLVLRGLPLEFTLKDVKSSTSELALFNVLNCTMTNNGIG